MRGPSYTGRVLGGRYSVGELLGEGGWGAVYAAIQLDLDRRVAIKILHVDVALAYEAVSRFQREARAAAALGHPNIAQVTDFSPGSDAEPPFLVMELLTGATMGALLKRQSVLPPPRVTAIAFQMLAALDVAHRAGIVHRDVKPDNVFLVSMPGINDFVKLLDFGIAKLSSENVAQLTGDGQMLGSPAFMSPEQVRSAAIDHRSDLHAVGTTMYFAMTGRLPFDTKNMATLLTAILEQPPAPLASVAPGVDPRLCALVERALEKDPSRRFASAADMRAALEPWIATTSMVTPIERSATRAPLIATRAPTPPPVARIPAPLSSQASTGPIAAYGQPPAHYDPPPAPYGLPPTPPPTLQSAPGTPYGAAAMTPNAGAPSQSKSSNGTIIGLLIAIVALLVVGGLGVAGALFYFAARPPASSSGAPSASPVAAAPSASTTSTSAEPVPTASGPTPKSGATRVTPAPNPPGPTPPGPTPGPTPAAVDAGASRVATVDAGATKKQWAGAVPKIAGGTFESYGVEKGKASVQRVMPQLTACYAATEFDPPDHQFTTWTLTVDPSGNVTSARRTTNYEPHAKLDPCVIAALRMTKWEALAGGGSPQISLTARTRDNP